MEPLDPGKNEESSGFSKRRISSILKAPQRSIRFPDPEQQENVVECVRPVEKRNSRRVSFAPANDVLLFSKDVKNASPVRSPLQELITTSASHTQNRVQVAVTEDGIQQIAGMETLLNAPLHGSQQRDKVNFGTGVDFGEKTVMFSTDDAFMDTTHCHTINIANDGDLFADVSLQNFDILPTGGKKTVMFTGDDGSMDMARSRTVNMTSGSLPANVDLRVEQICSSVPSLDPGFENFLASLSKPSGINPVITKMTPPVEEINFSLPQIKTQRADVDKENQPVTSVLSVMEKSLNVSRKIGESYGGALCPEDDVSMDMTEAQTGRIQQFTNDDDDDDPFQCLFPTQEMYTHLENKVSQAAETLTSSNTKDTLSLKNPSLHAPHQRHMVNLDAKPECREKTIRTDDALQRLFPTQDLYHQSGHLKKAEMTSRQQHSEALGSYKHKVMDTTLTTSLKTKVQRHQVKFDNEEKTVRFTSDDPCMDVTQSHTVNIVSDVKLQSHQNQDIYPAYGEKTLRFNANDAAMDVTRSHTGNIATYLEAQSCKNLDILPACGEKTLRFSANDAAMDVTRSHTGNIATYLEAQSCKNLDILPACGEKTLRFTANDAAMDVTQSHTVNIAMDFKEKSCQNVDILPACGEKTLRFNANDAAMDMTQSHTGNIALDFKPQSCQDVDILPACGEKTLRFTANDAAMDMTQSHTGNIALDFKPQSCQNVDILPACGEKMLRFTANDASMDITQCLTANIANNSVSDSALPHQDSSILSTRDNNDFPLSVKKRENEACRLRRNRSLSAHTLDRGFKNSLSSISGPCINPGITKTVAPAAPSSHETEDPNPFLDHLKTQKPDVDTETEAPGFVSAVTQKPVNKTVTEDDVSMDMTEAQTGHILRQTCTDEPPQGLSSTQDLYNNSDHLKKTDVTSKQRSGESNPDFVEITNHPDSLHQNETDACKEPRNQTCSLSQKMESPPSAVDHDVDTGPSRKSRRMSLADLHSKVRRLSHMINTAPETFAIDSRTAPLPLPEQDMDINSKDKTKPLPVTEPELEMGLVNVEENTQAQRLTQGEQLPTTTTPFNLKTKQLMSRLSVGGFKPKLPQRSKPHDPKTSVGEHTRTITVNVTNQLSNFDNDVSDIYDEELDSCEDMSEVLDTRSPQKVTETGSPQQELDMDEPLMDDVFEQDCISAVYGKKRSLPVDDNNIEDEKRMKGSTETATDIETGFQSHVVECDANITTAPSMTTQSTDYSNSSHTATMRCEATFESTFKQSFFESQLEDCTTDARRRLDDGTITVLEFFKLFNIDFVIHNPRQSVLPGRLLSDTDCTPLDLLKDKHINRPKQMVYETDVLNLTEKVEGLKGRMRDLDKPLKIVNRPLWEEIRNSSEKELKSFGAKLKERNNLFRKMSKVQSHEMKEVLYSNLVKANLEEQQRLRGTIKEADEMIKSLDDCIHELETELAAVEEKGSEETPSLKLLQEEMQKVTEALADNSRKLTELEMEKMQHSTKVKKLKSETRELQSHVGMIHTVNEWRFGEKTENCTVYTFLHQTFHLQLVYEKSEGDDADHQSERKISHMTFNLQINEEKSKDHACLVHQLLRQYIDGETAWMEKYQTSRDVPKLLHDVGLVVSRCRLLGEELRLLKMWGGLRLDILSINCVDTRVHIVFSSLKKLTKFEVIFSVSLTNNLCALQVQSFKTVFGSTTLQQIEEIVASFSPGKNLLTKIVKKIHEDLLC